MTDNRTFLDSLRAYGFVKEEPRAVVNAGPPILVRDDAGASRYLETAVANEVEKVRTAPEGTRNHTLNTAAYSLGQLVAGTNLDRATVTEQLTAAALAAGLDTIEITRTIRSGLDAGEKEPRSPELRVIDVPPVTVFDDEAADVATIAAFIDEHLPRLDWHALFADESEEEWIVEPLLPARRLVALYSAPKVGKSLLMLEIAVAVATGREVLGTTPDPRRVLYVDFENDPKADIRERLLNMRVGPDDLERLDYLSFPSLSALDSDSGGKQLLAAVKHYASEVVVIDTVSRAIAGDENENDTWLGFYRHTGLRLKKAGVALVRLDHSGKDETKGQRGGSAKSGDVDAVWRLSRVTEEQYRLDCEAARMPVFERTLMLHRENVPLRHRVEGSGTAAVRDALIAAGVRILDTVNANADITVRDAAALLRDNGWKGQQKLVSTVIRNRKNVLPDLG